MRKVEHKPLSFSTTMRNPERIAEFVNCIKDFERSDFNRIYNNENCKNLIKNKLYKPMSITKDNNLYAIYLDENLYFSDSQLNKIIENSPQNHKRGWIPQRLELVGSILGINYARNLDLCIMKWISE